MAPRSTESLAHFMHPPHRLSELTADTPYHCDGCKISGTGTRFTCTTCKFNLHEYCAKCPTTWHITTPTHPHPLSLYVHKHKFKRTRPCQICHKRVEGLAYRCKGCKYLVHPLCVSSSSGVRQDKETERIDPQDVVELAANLTCEKVKGDGDHISIASSNASNGSSGSKTSGGGGGGGGGGDDHEGIFEAIIKGFGHMFEN